MTTTAPAPSSSEALREQLDDLALRHSNALTREKEATQAWEIADARKELGEVDEDAEQQAKSALTEAKAITASIARAMALVKTRIADAEEREAAERRAELAIAAKDTDKARAAAAKRLATALASTEAAFEAFDRANATAGHLRSEAIRLRDLDRQEAELSDRYRERIAELEATKVPGWEPNYGSLELRYERELADLRAAARAEAESLAPPVDDSALREIIDTHAALVPRLIDSASRLALAQGREFVSPPRRVAEMPRGAIGRHYADFEIEVARERHQAFLDAIERLGGSAPSLADAGWPMTRPV